MTISLRHKICIKCNHKMPYSTKECYRCKGGYSDKKVPLPSIKKPTKPIIEDDYGNCKKCGEEFLKRQAKSVYCIFCRRTV